jgi:hypothetical protein
MNHPQLILKFPHTGLLGVRLANMKFPPQFMLVRCLQACPKCPHLPEEIRRSQAEEALRLLKEIFPWLPEPEDQEG